MSRPKAFLSRCTHVTVLEKWATLIGGHNRMAHLTAYTASKNGSSTRAAVLSTVQEPTTASMLGPVTYLAPFNN